jgi:hypothetical protein
VYVTLTRLRDLGLRELILNERGGYLLDPSQTITLSSSEDRLWLDEVASPQRATGSEPPPHMPSACAGAKFAAGETLSMCTPSDRIVGDA